MPQKLFGMISFVAVLALILGDLVLNCQILKQQPLEENNSNNNNMNESTNSFNITHNNNI